MEGTFSFHRQTPSGREAPLGFSYTILCNAGFIFQSQKYYICKILYSYPLAIQRNTKTSDRYPQSVFTTHLYTRLKHSKNLSPWNHHLTDWIPHRGKFLLILRHHIPLHHLFIMMQIKGRSLQIPSGFLHFFQWNEKVLSIIKCYNSAMNTKTLIIPSAACGNPQKRSIKHLTKCPKTTKKRKNKWNRKKSDFFWKNLLTFKRLLYIISLALRVMQNFNTEKNKRICAFSSVGRAPDS